MTEAVTTLSIHLRVGLDYLEAMPIDKLNEIAETVNKCVEEVGKSGKK